MYVVGEHIQTFLAVFSGTGMLYNSQPYRHFLKPLTFQEIKFTCSYVGFDTESPICQSIC